MELYKQWEPIEKPTEKPIDLEEELIPAYESMAPQKAYRKQIGGGGGGSGS